MIAQRRKVVCVLMVSFFLLLPLSSLSGEVGVSDTEIVIGTSQPVTGGMAFIGNQNISGMTVMIDEVNKKGGFWGGRSGTCSWMMDIARIGISPMFEG